MAKSTEKSPNNHNFSTTPKKRGRKPNHLKTTPIGVSLNTSNIQKEKVDDVMNAFCPPPHSNEGGLLVPITSNGSNAPFEIPEQSIGSNGRGVEKHKKREDIVELHDDHLILHLNVKDTKDGDNVFTMNETNYYETNFFEYTPHINEPSAYDVIDDDKFSSCPQLVDATAMVKHKGDASIRSSPKTIKELFDIQIKNNENVNPTSSNMNKEQDTNIDVLNYEYTNSHGSSSSKSSKPNASSDASFSTKCVLKDLMVNNRWCDKTNYHCYWDCHPFDTQPYGIPIKFKDNKFYVSGCFCSMECAVAYSFYSNDMLGDAWERYNMINMMSSRMNYTHIVKPALPRKCLKIFGGEMDIDTFREKSQNGAIVDIMHYPMVLLVEQIDEITNSYDKHNHNFIPLDKTRIEKIEEANKDRSILKQKSVLEKSMNLKIVDAL
jgi:hypothetical protein